MPTQNEQQPKSRATRAELQEQNSDLIRENEDLSGRKPVKDVYVHDLSNQRPSGGRGNRAGFIAVAGLAGAVALAGVAYALGKNENPNYKPSTANPTATAGQASPTPAGVAGLETVAPVITQAPAETQPAQTQPAETQAPVVTAAPQTEAPATVEPVVTEAPATVDPGSQESQAPVTGEWVAVPATLKEIKVMGLQGGSTAEDGTVFSQFEEGKWFHPLYDRFQVDPSKDLWRGVGPWYPVEFRNLDANAALLSTHGNVGELIVVSDQGGWVEVGFWQLDNYQDDGSWGRGPDGVGDIYQDGSWAMQYTFKELGANAEVLVIDPDTGNPYTREDGSPVIYRANDMGTASFEIPQTDGNDVRVAFRFQMPFASEAVQPHEVKIERGPNDRPRRTGENLLPDSVLKPEVPLE